VESPGPGVPALLACQPGADFAAVKRHMHHDTAANRLWDHRDEREDATESGTSRDVYVTSTPRPRTRVDRAATATTRHAEGRY
jgi:hypothetical protein